MKIFHQLLGIVLLIQYFINGTLIEPKYNFGDQQNYQIDLLYNHLLGKNIYFNSSSQTNGKILYSVSILADLRLEIMLKFYTTSIEITNALKNKETLFLAIDLNITNTDFSTSYSRYTTDIIGCELTLKDAQCYDYVYDRNSDKFLKNKNGTICKNNLVPLGFDDIQVNILKENIIDFDNYYSIVLFKKYPENFDNITMFNWINYVASDMDHYINGFYGLAKTSNELDSFNKTKMMYYNNTKYTDGSGLTNRQYYHTPSMVALILLCLIL